DSDYSGEGIPLDPTTAIIVIVVVIVLGLITGRKRVRKGAAAAPNIAGGAATVMNSAALAALREKDPGFSEAILCEKLGNVYVRMQESWERKEFDPMRPYLTDGLFNQLRNQLDEFIRNGTTNRVDNICVLSVVLTNFVSTPELDILTARLRTRITDYVVRDDTGEIVSGSDAQDLFMEYEWTVVRKAGVLTRVQTDETEAKTCPQCGAPLDLNYSSKCDYCGNVVTSSEFDWVVSAIRGISKQTVNR
ncbi:MAG: TIM44-like domain-containing protein, partial [Clostridia bacterium]|nr:TIM44-like domain-containing protein [Clostridia bacterium]